MLNLGYGQIEVLLKLTLGVSPAKGIALKGRLKHFQRAGFPPNTNVGRGPKARYGPEETFAIIFAFELLRLRVPPLTAVQIITGNWNLFRRMLVMGWRAWLDVEGSGAAPEISQSTDSEATGAAASRRPTDQKFFAVIFADGLEDLRREGRSSGEKDKVRIVSAEEITYWLTGPQRPPASAIQLLDFMSVVSITLDALVALGIESLKEKRAYHAIALTELIDRADTAFPSDE